MARISYNQITDQALKPIHHCNLTNVRKKRLCSLVMLLLKKFMPRLKKVFDLAEKMCLQFSAGAFVYISTPSLFKHNRISIIFFSKKPLIVWFIFLWGLVGVMLHWRSLSLSCRRFPAKLNEWMIWCLVWY